jgi:hypothetical protein
MRQRPTTFFNTTVTLIASLALLVAGCLAGAGELSPLTGDDQAAIIEQISSALLETYVFPEDAEAMAKRLGEQLDSGAYDDLREVLTFCNQLTQDLQSVRRDLHLHVDPMPPQPTRTSDEDATGQQRKMREYLRRINYGFRKVEVLEGNIGYLRLDGFIDAGIGGTTAVAAMGFLANADAVIFDLRYNGGGYPSMIQLLSSYLFEDPTHLNSFYIRKSDTMKQFWTQSHVQGKRLAEVPVFVLTSGRTFSGAEEFTYNLKHLERATIVGETTGGGAHPVERFFLEGYPIAVALPFGRAVNPVTGKNWEATGVEPHIKVDADQALDTAHLEALEMLAEAADDPDHKWKLELNHAGVKARISPIELNEAQMLGYVGVYGPAEVRILDGHLVGLRQGGFRARMVAIGDDRFLFEGIDGLLVSFERNTGGEVTAVVAHQPDGVEERYRREQR